MSLHKNKSQVQFFQFRFKGAILACLLFLTLPFTSSKSCAAHYEANYDAFLYYWNLEIIGYGAIAVQASIENRKNDRIAIAYLYWYYAGLAADYQAWYGGANKAASNGGMGGVYYDYFAEIGDYYYSIAGKFP